MGANRASLSDPWRASRFRLLGLLPLCFFGARLIEYVVVAKTPEQILWLCHISNLLLAVGMLAASPFLIRVAVFWLILGAPPWVVDIAYSKSVTPTSIVSHVGGFIVAVVAIRRVGASRRSWIPSLIFFLILQQITRLLTEPGPYTNINVAHFAYGPARDWFASYWEYWLANTALVAAALIALETILTRLYRNPAPPLT